MPLRVLMADSASEKPGALAELLSEHDDIEIVGHAKKMIEALTLIERLRPHAVLLDMEMPGNTLDYVLKLIKSEACSPFIVVLIPYASGALRERALDAGADYVFPKTGDPDRVVTALTKLIGTEKRRELP
jgi:DNA-binding NarL/FixJ family response regulator